MDFFVIFAPETIFIFLWEMRKILALTAVLLCCYFTTYSQEAKAAGNLPTLIISPRFEVNPYLPTGSGGIKGVDFGNTSLYTFLDGEIGNFSYSMSNHWLSTEPAALYQNAFRSDDVDFIDWLTLSYTIDRFTITAGKDMISIGSYELDANDIDQHPTLCSTLWHNMPIYQWGASVEYTSEDETLSLAFQFSTSPFGEYPFRSKLFSYSFIWYGEYGCFAPIWSANLIETEPGKFIKIASLGNGFFFDNCAIETDITNKFYDNEYELSLIGKFGYTFDDTVEVFVKGGYEYRTGYDFFGYEDEFSFIPTDAGNYAFYGGGVNYYPLKNSTDLRLHAVIASNNYAKSIALSIGATYHFNLTDTIHKRK